MVETVQWQQVKRLFNEARERPASDRSSFLAAACGDDHRLRAAVEALLAADAEAGTFLASPTGDGQGPPDPADASRLIQQLQRALAGRYSIERELGRGGMAIVYLARDVALDRSVAVKLLPPRLASALDYRERFLREARTAAGLSHPNIVPIHLVEEKDDLVYFVMSYVDGESLGERVRRAGPLKPADAARLVQEVAWALGYAHGRGVIHRDIKPDNILIDKGSGRALVTDFGIARVTSAKTVSRQGDVLGTLAYMSPEQASAEPVIDGRTDLYSLGVTAFFALTGRLPFDSPNPAALIAMHLAEPAPPLRSVSGVVPARLAEAVDRCLAKDPAARFPTGEALAEAIADAQLTRREIAPSVRAFLGTTKSAMLQMTGLGVIGLWTAAWAEDLPSYAITDPFLFLVGLLAVVVAIRPVFAARGVLRAGLDEHDVAEAAASSAAARDANVEHTLAQVEWLRTPWARGASTLAFAGSIWFLVASAWTDQSLGRLLQTLIGITWGGFCLGLAIKPELLAGALAGGSPEVANVLRRLWAGPVGRWFFRIAGIGLEKGKALPAPESAPTEVLLGRAAAELFQQLPKDQRARLGDVQDVIRSLERAAAGLRVRRDALHQGLADAGAPSASPRRAQLVTELEAARTAVEKRLGTAVAALENLRLDLLRLRAGVGNADDFTASIEEARSVGEAVDIELAARRELESIAHLTPP